MGRFAVVDDDGNVTNVVVWDGTSDWTPPSGRPVEVPDGAAAEPGGRREVSDGKPVWVPAPRDGR